MGSTPSGSADLPFPLRLPDALRGELREPLGRLLSGGEVLGALAGVRRVATVGDYCTSDLIQRGRTPHVAVVDRRTRRSPNAALAQAFARFPGRRVRVANPAGQITAELWRAVDEAFKSPGRVLIEVEGEEDLAALPCIALAPEGAAVLYGLPDRGVVLVVVTAAARARALDILRRMEGGA